MSYDFYDTKVKDKTLLFSRHKQFIISYSSVAHIEESVSLELKILRKTEEFEFKGSCKAMAIFKTDCAKFLLYNSVFLLLDPKMCIWKHAYKCMMICSFSNYSFSLLLLAIILPNSDNIFGSTLFGVFPAFSYFICLYQWTQEIWWYSFTWSYFEAPKS